MDKAFNVISDRDHALDELHLVTKSYINGSHDLYVHLPNFIATRIRFELEPSGTQEQRHSFWAFFVDNEIILDLCVSLDIRFVDGWLLISKHAEHMDDPWDAVLTVLMHLCKWSTFLKMRWGGCGPSTRLLLRSWAGGAEALARYTLSLPGVNATNLCGIGRASANVKLLATITAFAAGPAETLLENMFHDDRVFMHAADYRGQLDEEVDRLLDVPDYTWTRLAAMIGTAMDIAQLMHLAFKGAFISYGYLWFHIFKQLLDGLLMLTQ